MQIDRIGDELAKAYKDGYQKGLKESAQYIAHALLSQRETEQESVEQEMTCEDEGTCIPSTVLGSFLEETWEQVVSSSQWGIGMDREIKFRAWDKNRKIMFDVYGIDPNHVIPWGRSGPGIPPDREDVVLMQYTGLKDRSGKQIYEGDIVKAHFNKNPLPVRWHTRYAAWFVGGGHRLRMFHEEGVEVIGNIYEHNHLLG